MPADLGWMALDLLNAADSKTDVYEASAYKACTLIKCLL